MRKILLGLGLLSMLVSQVAYAQEDAIQPPVTDIVASEESTIPDILTGFKDVVNALKPSAGIYYNIEEDAWNPVVSGTVYPFTSSSIYLGGITAGYSTSNDVLTGLDVDLPGIATRYLGGRWGQLDTILVAVSKYARTGVSASYDFESQDFGWGPTFGASFRF